MRRDGHDLFSYSAVYRLCSLSDTAPTFVSVVSRLRHPPTAIRNAFAAINASTRARSDTHANTHTNQSSARRYTSLSGTRLSLTICSYFVSFFYTNLRRRSSTNFTVLARVPHLVRLQHTTPPAYTMRMCGRALRPASEASAAAWVDSAPRARPHATGAALHVRGRESAVGVCVRVPCSQSGCGVMVAMQSRDHNPFPLPLSLPSPFPSPLVDATSSRRRLQHAACLRATSPFRITRTLTCSRHH